MTINRDSAFTGGSAWALRNLHFTEVAAHYSVAPRLQKNNSLYYVLHAVESVGS
jgi:hypothetical protein